MANLALEAQARDKTGTGSARALRSAQRIPAVIYGDSAKPLHVSLPLKEIALNCSKKSFKSTVIEITVDGKKILALPRELQLNLVTDIPEHLDLQVVSNKKATKVFVPMKVSGQLKSPGIKRGGVLNIVRREIEFYCQPGKIPTEVNVDVSSLDIGRSIHINDIKLPEGVNSVIKRNFTLVTIVGKGAEEDTASTTAAAAAVAGGAAAPAAGAAAAPAAGAADAKKADAKPAAKK